MGRTFVRLGVCLLLAAGWALAQNWNVGNFLRHDIAVSPGCSGAVPYTKTSLDLKLNLELSLNCTGDTLKLTLSFLDIHSSIPMVSFDEQKAQVTEETATDVRGQMIADFTMAASTKFDSTTLLIRSDKDARLQAQCPDAYWTGPENSSFTTRSISHGSRCNQGQRMNMGNKVGGLPPTTAYFTTSFKAVAGTSNKSGIWMEAVVKTHYKLAYSGGPPVDLGDVGQPAPPVMKAVPSSTSTTFVSRPESTYQTTCSFNSSVVHFEIPITRYVAPVFVEKPGDVGGFLYYPDLNVRNGVVSPRATLRIYAWDVDSGAPRTATRAPERDRVSLNNRIVGYLSGEDRKWSTSTFVVGINNLRFPQLQSPSNPWLPQGGWRGLNQVSIDVDRDNYNGGYTEPWCVAVSWASLSFDAMDPLMLIHGTNAQSTTWELDAGGGSLVTILKDMEIPFEHRIDLVPNGSADENARLLRNALRAQATRFGVERLHLITHSKGTTDARRMLTLYGEALLNYPLRFLSLYSIGAPSQGTSLSDIAMAAGYFPHANVEFDAVLQNAVVDSVAANWASIVGLAPSDPARALQTILGMNDFNLANPKPPNAGRMYSIAGDADNNGNGKIDNFDEARAFFGPEIVQSAQVMLANDMYQALGRVLFVSLRQVGLSESEWSIAFAPMRPALVPNDMVSTAESVHCARCGFVRLADFNLNHSMLKSRVVLDRILQQIRQDYPLQPEGR